MDQITFYMLPLIFFLKCWNGTHDLLTAPSAQNQLFQVTRPLRLLLRLPLLLRLRLPVPLRLPLLRLRLLVPTGVVSAAAPHRALAGTGLPPPAEPLGSQKHVARRRPAARPAAPAVAWAVAGGQGAAGLVAEGWRWGSRAAASGRKDGGPEPKPLREWKNG